MILESLGCSREVRLLERYLGWTLDNSSGIREQDRDIVFNAVAQREVGFSVAKAFLFNKIDQIYKRYGFENEENHTKRLNLLSFEYKIAVYIRIRVELVDIWAFSQPNSSPKKSIANLKNLYKTIQKFSRPNKKPSRNRKKRFRSIFIGMKSIT